MERKKREEAKWEVAKCSRALDLLPVLENPTPSQERRKLSQLPLLLSQERPKLSLKLIARSNAIKQKKGIKDRGDEQRELPQDTNKSSVAFLLPRRGVVYGTALGAKPGMGRAARHAAQPVT